MPILHQMGHHSENLLFVPELAGYAGAILSPTNNTPAEMMRRITDRRNELPAGFQLLFDPQLYYPSTERGVLDSWSYFPSDVDTADLSSHGWWQGIIERLCDDAVQVGAAAVCSPIAVPRAYSDGFYARAVDVASELKARLPDGIRTVQTALVDPADLTVAGRPMAIASILTRSDLDEIYLVAVTDVEPRREHGDTEGLKGIMQLIQALSDAGANVTVGFSSSDLLLWKHAGAHSCATGKHFNLRRFASSRWGEPREGGRILPYMFEESVLAFLRESDVIRLRQEGLITNETNPFLDEIENSIAQGEPWVGLSWRHFLHWFADAEQRLEAGALDTRAALKTAEDNWRALEDADVFMEERRNDGGWIRPWRRAVAEYSR
jgi:hypothetical protein